MSGYTKAEAKRVLSQTLGRLSGPFYLFSWHVINDLNSMEFSQDEIRGQGFESLAMLFRYFREVKPRGRYAVSIIDGKDTPERKAGVFFVDTDLWEKAQGG